MFCKRPEATTSGLFLLAQNEKRSLRTKSGQNKGKSRKRIKSKEKKEEKESDKKMRREEKN
jgi:hypothetical protein